MPLQGCRLSRCDPRSPIESERMGGMSVQQRNRMAPRRVRPALGLDSMFIRKVRDHAARNQIAHFIQCCILMLGLVCVFSLFFSYPPSGGFRAHRPSFSLRAIG